MSYEIEYFLISSSVLNAATVFKSPGGEGRSFRMYGQGHKVIAMDNDPTIYTGTLRRINDGYGFIMDPYDARGNAPKDLRMIQGRRGGVFVSAAGLRRFVPNMPALIMQALDGKVVQFSIGASQRHPGRVEARDILLKKMLAWNGEGVRLYLAQEPPVTMEDVVGQLKADFGDAWRDLVVINNPEHNHFGALLAVVTPPVSPSSGDEVVHD